MDSTPRDEPGSGESAKALPPTPRLHHVNLKTTQLREMIAWYEQVLGMEAVHVADGKGAWLTNDAANHRLALLTTPELRDDPDQTQHAGLHHTAYEYESVDDLFAAFAHITENVGSEPHMCLDHGMTLSFYFVDPDGNSLELQADWFGDWEQSQRFMRESPAFAEDPIGTFVDPRAMIAARANGASVDELHERATNGEYPPATAPTMRLAGAQ